jgi:ubiquinone/menaquinone biosynthesis C-methylase UbiE
MKDNFSKQASIYAKYRPTYPPELFKFIVSHVEEKSSAWDCATGNGQTAKELAKHFKKVYATDISRKQLDNSEQVSNIIYSLQPAEKTNFEDNKFDLITVSQALHWFQFDKFYAEVKRVAKPGSRIAVWMYGLLTISPEIDKLISEYHFKTLGKYWDKERQYVDDNYMSIPFPFEEISCPIFQIQYEWTIEELEGYLNTWSAVQKFVSVNDYSPVDELVQKIKPCWINQKMNIIFPLHLRVGRIDK